jgi:hypothetical protein
MISRLFVAVQEGSKESDLRCSVRVDEPDSRCCSSTQVFDSFFSECLCRSLYMKMRPLQTVFTVPFLRYQCWAVEGAWTQEREDRMSGLVPPIADSFIAHPPIVIKTCGTDLGEACVLPDRGRH